MTHKRSKTSRKAGQKKMKLAITHHAKAITTDAWMMGLDTWHELRLKGFGDRHSQILDHTLRAVNARDEKGVTVGFILWNAQEWCGNAFIQLAGVRPEYRRMGVYTQLYKALCVEAKKQGFIKVSSGVDVTNTAMQAAAEKTGRKAVAIYYEASL